MSYQARITYPPLIVTGCSGAWGNTKRTARPSNPSSGTTGTKSLPSAPRPCIQITLEVGSGAVSISMVGSGSSGTWRLGLARTHGRFRPERFDHCFVGLDVGT